MFPWSRLLQCNYCLWRFRTCNISNGPKTAWQDCPRLWSTCGIRSALARQRQRGIGRSDTVRQTPRHSSTWHNESATGQNGKLMGQKNGNHGSCNAAVTTSSQMSEVHGPGHLMTCSCQPIRISTRSRNTSSRALARLLHHDYVAVPLTDSYTVFGTRRGSHVVAVIECQLISY